MKDYMCMVLTCICSLNYVVVWRHQNANNEYLWNDQLCHKLSLINRWLACVFLWWAADTVVNYYAVIFIVLIIVCIVCVCVCVNFQLSSEFCLFSGCVAFIIDHHLNRYYSNLYIKWSLCNIFFRFESLVCLNGK